MSRFIQFLGIVGQFFQIGGPAGAAFKHNSGVLEARNAADSVFVVVRVAEPTLANDALPNGDFLLDNEPDSLNNTYSNTITGGKVTQEKWIRTVGATNIKTIDYTYTGSKVTTEVRKVYATDGTTIIAQMTLTYTYTVSTVTGIVSTRDV
jgi:hypothetical protein